MLGNDQIRPKVILKKKIKKKFNFDNSDELDNWKNAQDWICAGHEFRLSFAQSFVLKPFLWAAIKLIIKGKSHGTVCKAEQRAN